MDINDIIGEFDSACTRLDEARKAREQLNKLQAAIDDFLQARPGAPRPAELVRRITAVRRHLGRVSTQTMPKSHDPGVLRLQANDGQPS